MREPSAQSLTGRESRGARGPAHAADQAYRALVALAPRRSRPHLDRYTMDIQNVGGTPGGTRTFLLGMIMAIAGGYLLFQQVSVGGGYWSWNMFGGAGRSFGITLLPLLLGIGILFANGRSLVGRFLTFG